MPCSTIIRTHTSSSRFMHPEGENNLKFNNFHIVEFFMNPRVVRHFPNNIIINSLHCIFIERARVSCQRTALGVVSAHCV